jgi:acyl dehydratase
MQGNNNSLYFEDFHEGMPPIQTPTRTIAQDDINIFATLTGDTNPIHTDPTFAEQSVFGQQVAHGMLMQSIASGLGWQANLFGDAKVIHKETRWEFKRPVFPGDTVKARIRVGSTEPAPKGRNGGTVLFKVQLTNQNDKDVGVGTWTVIISGRPVTATEEAQTLAVTTAA